jgi:CRP/FNR family transcriptional regulator, cyclic AMP receptor protein
MSLGALSRGTSVALPVGSDRIQAPASPFVLDEQARVRAILSKVAVFRDLPGIAHDEIARRLVLARTPGGGTILTPETEGAGLHIVMAGRVKLVVPGDNGREVTLAVLRPGDVFGELALFGATGRNPQVVAIDPATTLLLPREDLMRLLAQYPEASLAFLGELSRRMRRAEETIAELALCDVQDRLVRRLISLAQDDGMELPEGVLIRRRPTQQDLANMVGACRETISRTFNSLARKGLIVPRGRSLLVTRRLVSPSA